MQNLSIDLSMLVTSLKAIRENTTYLEFDEVLNCLKQANDMGKLEEFLSQAEYIHTEGTDLASSFHFALVDVLQDPGENL